ncbi:MAG: restriction endonuclease [Muribaculaceae bacterium]
MMHIPSDFYIKCDNCGNVTLVEADSLDYETSVCDRPMGEEIEYDFRGEICCDGCHSWIDFDIRGYEYPVGAFNFSDSECQGGSFIGGPVVEMDYEFDADYYDAAYAEYESAKYLLEYNREQIKRMSPRDFEYFVAEIFKKLGFSVKITQATRDGGKDIIATKADPIPYTLIIECKHWGESHKVDVSVVRSVYGVQMAMQANQSIIVTSSKFTRDAREFAENQKSLMALWDMDDLLKLVVN